MNQKFDLFSAEQAAETQNKRLDAYRKLFMSVFLKEWTYILFSFFSATCVIVVLLWIQISFSQDRYLAQTSLFFYPRNSEKNKAMDIKQVLELLSRHSVLVRLTDEFHAQNKDMQFSGSQMKIELVKNRPNLIQISGSAESKKKAVQLVNLLAAICMDEYITFRTEDLDNRLGPLTQQKKDLEKKIAQNETKQNEIIQSLNFMTPQQELDRLRRLITEKMAMLSDLNVQYANEESHVKRLQEQLKTLGTEIQKILPVLKTYQEKIELKEKEYVKLQQIYTEKNPKLISLRTEIDTLKAEVDQFLQEKKIDNYRPEMLAEIEQMKETLAESTRKLDFIQQNRNALKLEQERNQKQIEQLNQLLPKFNEILRAQNSDLQTANALDENMADLLLQKASMKNELKQVERATFANEQNNFGKKKLLLAIFLGGVFATGTGVVLSALQILFGNVWNLKELEDFEELTPVGEYPALPQSFASPEEKNLVQSKIYYKLRDAMKQKRILFRGIMPGAIAMEELQESLAWNAAMNGIKIFQIQVVSSQEFEDQKIQNDDPENPLALICKNGQNAYMPVENLRALAPAEFELLKSDLNVLLKQYDLIVIARDAELNAHELFFKQMLDFCDATILLLGAEVTSRRLLRYTIRLQQQTQKTMMVLLTEVKHWTNSKG